MLNRSLVNHLQLDLFDTDTEDDTELWQPIPGYHSCYEVSSYGRVRSLNRRINVVRNGQRFSYDRPGQLLKPSMHSGGAVIVTLHSDGRYKTKTLRRLVALAFVPCNRNPDQMIVCHRDRDPWNCHRDNLFWRADVR